MPVTIQFAAEVVAWLHDELKETRAELRDVTGQRDAFEHELALCEQDLRHALTRISELCEQLEALKAGLV